MSTACWVMPSVHRCSVSVLKVRGHYPWPTVGGSTTPALLYLTDGWYASTPILVCAKFFV